MLFGVPSLDISRNEVEDALRVFVENIALDYVRTAKNFGIFIAINLNVRPLIKKLIQKAFLNLKRK